MKNNCFGAPIMKNDCAKAPTKQVNFGQMFAPCSVGCTDVRRFFIWPLACRSKSVLLDPT
jgi:hypothetical protein